MTKVEVFKCELHGEQELLGREDTTKPAFCPECGKAMNKVPGGEYEE